MGQPRFELIVAADAARGMTRASTGCTAAGHERGSNAELRRRIMNAFISYDNAQRSSGKIAPKLTAGSAPK